MTIPSFPIRAKICVVTGYIAVILHIFQQIFPDGSLNAAMSGMKFFALLLLCIVCLSWMKDTLQSRMKNIRWQTAHGTIDTVVIKPFSFEGFDYYDVLLTFSFSVYGKQHTSQASLTNRNMICETREAAEQLAQQYPPGQTIAIRYNPNKPKQSEMM